MEEFLERVKGCIKYKLMGFGSRQAKLGSFTTPTNQNHEDLKMLFILSF